MPNFMDTHLNNTMPTEKNLNNRKMYLHLAGAFLFGVLPAGVIYAMEDKLGAASGRMGWAGS